MTLSRKLADYNAACSRRDLGLLSNDGLRRLEAELFGPAGADMASPLSVEVLCPAGLSVREDEGCERCPHGCTTPGPDCPGR